jgi:hypothetical protein
MIEDFFTPKLSGARFRDKTIPLDMLSDVAALQELLVELARVAYLEAHPERTRAPRNFYDNVQIHLAAVEPGSAKLKLVLFFAGLFPEYGAAFQKAQAQVTEAVATVARGQQPTMDSKFLAYFDRVGRGLREGESFDFPTGKGDDYVALNHDTRLALIQASRVEEYTELATLRVRVPMTDYRSERFEVQLQDGTILAGKIAPTVSEQLADAHRGYRDGTNDWLLIKGIVRKERSGKIKGIDSVEHANPIDPLDTSFRLKELASLGNGWLDGNGKALSAEDLDWLSESFDLMFATTNPLPRLFPTDDGMVLAEWIIGRQDIALEINLASKVGFYSQVNLDNDEDFEESLDFSVENGWTRLNELLSALNSSEENPPRG